MSSLLHKNKTRNECVRRDKKSFVPRFTPKRSGTIMVTLQIQIC